MCISVYEHGHINVGVLGGQNRDPDALELEL